MKSPHKPDRKKIFYRVIIILVTIYLMNKYVFDNWDNIEHFISNMFQ